MVDRGRKNGFPRVDMVENGLGFCVSALPNDASPPIRIKIAPAGAIDRDGHFLLGERILASFEDGFDNWLLKEEAVTNHHERYSGQQPIGGNMDRGFLTSYHSDKGDGATGRALSLAFTAESDQYLSFLIAGGMGSSVGLRLSVDGDEAMVWRGKNSERFEMVAYPLAEVAGRSLQLEPFDDETGGWGQLDHVMLARRNANDPQ